ncbi:type III-A CRISPR-associated protein Cas10/Csm1 [Caldovatus sediminis]|uniref:CRISPR system single-strand-specific deoxyribonuclease Cas10/Csm1 (subtype III-A) n=1 Tax=Caldovatus sediminis TaxID=2041189 RepID=A0A8J2Z7U9_9PROT|nr:type III-A CRISPR-associated protein Cas10/Csm1 [Caldovatus sediminis]GGG15790.1 type III-A CRISPR-associated protein Cas10/Csm1 [Caldovatus sediminis]
MAAELITPLEAALAGLLHDIGKLAQRAHPDEAALRAAYGGDPGGTESAILPLRDGRYTHRHALWSDFAIREAEREGLRWPKEVNGARLGAVAVRHHAPRHDDPSDWILAEADRLASGLERKERDEAEEAHGGTFRERELRALLPAIAIGRGAVPGAMWHPAEEASPEALPPQASAPKDQPRRFGLLWTAWQEGVRAFGRHGLSARRFERALLGLSERLLWAVPSSTVDQPDVSLHEHARAVAAIAAALAAWHGAKDTNEVAAVKDRSVPKFRLAALDLSGIQKALLRLDGQKGASRILRARSFLMGQTVEAALELMLEKLGLPFSSVLLNAGGKAELLLPDLPDLETRLEAVRGELDRWMVAHWQGDLALVLAAGPPFAAGQFLRRGPDNAVAEGYRQERAKLAAALDAAKLRPLAGWCGEGGLVGTGVIPAPFDPARGACASCGVRPAVIETPLDRAWRCTVCDAACRLGQRLPKAEGFALLEPEAAAREDAPAALPGGLRLAPWSERGAAARASFAFAREGAGSAVFRAPAHVPLVRDPADPRYAHAGIPEDERGAAGELMTFAAIGAEALEMHAGRIVGRDLLAIVKADVDFLGRVFADGLGRDRSPARVAQLSRLLDGYFAERLPWLLARRFPTTYTVYAGGDDLLLVAPWRFALPLALALREDFGAFSGGNPNLTLSAGIAFVHPRHPLALAVEEAEEALEAAKRGGRDRLGVFGRVLSWAGLGATLDLAEALNGAVRAEHLPPTFLHRMRWFAARRRAAEAGEARAADWNPKWRYQEARFLERAPAAARDSLRALLLRALPPPGRGGEADAEIAMTVALWRNR